MVGWNRESLHHTVFEVTEGTQSKMGDSATAAARLDALSFFARYRSRFLAISDDEVTFARRGFPADIPQARLRLERAGGAFVHGYNAAIAQRDVASLMDRVDEAPRDLSGFAHEGAAMGLALVDLILPWGRSRWREFLVRRYEPHIYLLLVGAGWAMARLRLRHLPRLARDADPLLWPLLWDGYGFHQGFFNPQVWIRRRTAPPLRHYAVRAFNQGLGRSLLFVEGGSAERIAATIAAFDAARQSDLWSGAGLASAYAGGADDLPLAWLADCAGPHRGSLAQGIVFAAKARVRATNVTQATESACRIVCGVSAAEAAAIADEELAATDAAGPTRYEAWRRRVAARFAL